MRDDREYWFPAKRYGWGWGAPRTWQGWATLLGHIALLAGGTILFDKRTQVGLYLLYVAVITGLLLFICVRTGEPPRWRWGKDD